MTSKEHAERAFEQMRFYCIPINAFKACIFMYDEIIKSNPTNYYNKNEYTHSFYREAKNHIVLMQKKYIDNDTQ